MVSEMLLELDDQAAAGGVGADGVPDPSIRAARAVAKVEARHPPTG